MNAVLDKSSNATKTIIHPPSTQHRINFHLECLQVMRCIWLGGKPSSLMLSRFQNTPLWP